jgi:hypothetical protein
MIHYIFAVQSFCSNILRDWFYSYKNFNFMILFLSSYKISLSFCCHLNLMFSLLVCATKTYRQTNLQRVYQQRNLIKIVVQ